MMTAVQLYQRTHLRNKFHFSEVYGNMNATNHPKGVTLTLHGTRCVGSGELIMLYTKFRGYWLVGFREEFHLVLSSPEQKAHT